MKKTPFLLLLGSLAAAPSASVEAAGRRSAHDRLHEARSDGRAFDGQRLRPRAGCRGHAVHATAGGAGRLGEGAHRPRVQLREALRRPYSEPAAPIVAPPAGTGEGSADEPGGGLSGGARGAALGGVTLAIVGMALGFPLLGLLAGAGLGLVAGAFGRGSPGGGSSAPFPGESPPAGSGGPEVVRVDFRG